MATKKIFDNPKQCCGCEACSQICPKGIIKMRSDKEVFFILILKMSLFVLTVDCAIKFAH